jgi:hypothetical protein
MNNHDVTEAVFDFDAIKRSLGVERVIDVDAAPSPRTREARGVPGSAGAP